MEGNKVIPGHIVLAELPHHDGTTKKRPSLLLKSMPPFGDYLSCGLSTQLRHLAPDFDELLLLDDPDFKLSGLQFPTLIRLGGVALIPETAIEGSIGNISEPRFNRMIKRLSNYLLT